MAGVLVGARRVSLPLGSSSLQQISAADQGCDSSFNCPGPARALIFNDSSISPAAGSNKPRILGNSLIYVISPAHHLQLIFFFFLAWELGFVDRGILSQWSLYQKELLGP